MWVPPCYTHTLHSHTQCCHFVTHFPLLTCSWYPFISFCLFKHHGVSEICSATKGLKKSSALNDTNSPLSPQIWIIGSLLYCNNYTLDLYNPYIFKSIFTVISFLSLQTNPAALQRNSQGKYWNSILVDRYFQWIFISFPVISLFLAKVIYYQWDLCIWVNT